MLKLNWLRDDEGNLPAFIRFFYRHFGKHAQWRLDRARRKRFRAFCQQHGVTPKKR